MEDNNTNNQNQEGQGGGANQQPPQPQTPQNNQPALQFDYEKLASIVTGKQTVAEDAVLKSYFKQQGLSESEMQQAISQYKQQKAASQPDVNAMQTQLAQAQTEAQRAQLQSAATMKAVELGIDAKTIPYVLKMADFSQVVGQDGKINDETLKNALNKVLEDVPALKPQAAGTAGFTQIGTPGAGGATEAAQQTMLDNIFGIRPQK